MTDDLIRRYAKPVPRYTSYPTAPHFHDGVGNSTYADWLRDLPGDTPLSLYAHIPFCDRLCWFCGCHTKQVLRYDPIAKYLLLLHREIETVGHLLDGRGRVSALHLGGGSPSMLRAEDMIALTQLIRGRFGGDGFEFSIEIDPNDMDEERFDAFAAAGVTRVSIGVQDFDPRVQEAINRVQTYGQTMAVVEGMRVRGVSSVNVDVLYGLPHQTVAGLESTIDQVIELHPDRIALFGYAHVPWMKPHQRLIPDEALPGVTARFRQSQAAAARLLDAGYVAVGIDHFALPADGLARAAAARRLHRNFQGYTTDEAPALLGFGASAIGSLPGGYVQNVTATGEYMRRIGEHGLAIARGFALSAEDRMRGWVIERLMCEFGVSLPELTARWGAAARGVADEMHFAALLDGDGLVRLDSERFSVTPKGRPFVRTIASTFDTHLTDRPRSYSTGV